MDETLHRTLATWGDFYVVTGTAAAALTGLQFVVQTLIASEWMGHVTGDDPEGGIAAFGTPTVVHFTVALILSAILCAPWNRYSELRVILGMIGSAALLYSAIVYRRTRDQSSYTPTGEDWLWHVVLPALANLSIVVTALLFHRGAEAALAAVAFATLLLLCVGIHNAWDTVTYLTIRAVRAKQEKTDAAPAVMDSENENPPGES